MRVLDVCLAMFPIVQSPLWLATLLHFARFCMCGSICLWLVWALCSCRCKRAPHVVFFVRSRGFRCECKEFVWNKSNEMIRKSRVKSLLIRRIKRVCFLNYPCKATKIRLSESKEGDRLSLAAGTFVWAALFFGADQYNLYPNARHRLMTSLVSKCHSLCPNVEIPLHIGDLRRPKSYIWWSV